MCDLAEMRLGFNDAVIRSEAVERAEVLIGVLLLILGFVLQIPASLFVSTAVPSRWDVLFGIASFMLVLLLSVRAISWLSRWFQRSAFREIIRRCFSRLGQKLEESGHRYNSLNVYANLLEIPHVGRPEEDVFEDVCQAVGIIPPQKKS